MNKAFSQVKLCKQNLDKAQASLNSAIDSIDYGAPLRSLILSFAEIGLFYSSEIISIIARRTDHSRSSINLKILAMRSEGLISGFGHIKIKCT